jgi:putative ABC transport system ATP-binding protein
VTPPHRTGTPSAGQAADAGDAETSAAGTLSTTTEGSLLRVSDLARSYGSSVVFRNVSLAMQAGEVLALLGASGVGKSTLLNCIAGLDRADGGTVQLQGRRVDTLSEPDAARLRRTQLGFIFQAFHVLPHLDVAHNIALPLLLLGRRDRQGVGERVDALLAAVGLAGLGGRAPRELSGGQLQRVAIARALVHEPALVLADEPTGNLDPTSAARVLDLLCAQAREHGASCLIVTHSAAAAQRADRVLYLDVDGVSPHPPAQPHPGA